MNQLSSKPYLTDRDIAAIAKVYDGRRETIDFLVKRYRLKRYEIARAARRGGYRPTRTRKTWRADDDEFLRTNWGRLDPEVMAQQLGCTLTALQLRKKRLGISTRHLEDWTIKDLEDASAGLHIDHRVWRRFIELGWLRCWHQPRLRAAPVTRISMSSLHDFLKAHPEVVDVAACNHYARGIFELERLPPPPRYKLLTCHAAGWRDGAVPTRVGSRDPLSDGQLEARTRRYSLSSCHESGGTDYWVPIHEHSPSCPRCGCKVSRFSEKVLYRDDPPGVDGTLNAIAGKLGLAWRDGRFMDGAGHAVKDEQLLRYVFNTRRSAGKAFDVFQKLLKAGLSVAPSTAISPGWLHPNILNYELREDQREVFELFMKTGGVSADSPCGWGKSVTAAYALANIVIPDPDNGSGGSLPQVVFTDTNLLRDDWIRKYRAAAPAVTVRHVRHPHAHVAVTLFDRSGARRVEILFYNYRTGEDFAGRRLGLVVYDEEHRLPGNHAHRLALLDCAAKFGASASRVREDGRENLLAMMTGQLYRKDWRAARQDGSLPDIPITVLVVRDKEDKFAAVQGLVRGKRAVVFSDSLADGRRFAAALSVPFIHAGTSRKIETMAAHQVFVMSRVGDTGLTIPDVQRVIDAVFHKGSRAQSIQRYGRLLHGRQGEGHWILMTPLELSRYYKRLSALEERGCRIKLRMHTGKPGRPPSTTPGRLVDHPVGPWQALLAGAPLKRAA